MVYGDLKPGQISVHLLTLTILYFILQKLASMHGLSKESQLMLRPLFWQLEQMRVRFIILAPFQGFLEVCVYFLSVLPNSLFLSDQFRILWDRTAKWIVHIWVFQERAPTCFFVHGFCWFEPYWFLGFINARFVSLISMKGTQRLKLIVLLDESCKLSFAFSKPSLVLIVLVVERFKISTVLNVFDVRVTGYNLLFLLLN